MSRTALRAWAELLRLPALFTVPGDALVGAASVGARPGRGTFLAIGSSLCLYEAGMALNDWADRAEDAVDRPHRPIPSGRIRPGAALAAAGALTAAGVGLASRAGRLPAALATALAATVWAYDLGLKHTPAGPAAMGAARGLDVLLGAGASQDAGAKSWSSATGAALTMTVHTTAVTAVSRHETTGGNALAPAAALATTATLAGALLRTPVGRGAAAPLGLPGPTAYALTAARPLLHAALNPSPPLTQRAVGAGIRAMIPLQAALTARAGAPAAALLTAALAPLARRFAKKVSVT
ncbi:MULTISPECIES: SCO3242 family prenyltransferase [unclassified Streptomyces]|uniref:SCO3242 family prenyltransferase n=1 Tax=unclassified Streptomyces TaxID=2593676 RepID=UPI000DBA3725|nr:MULTISPECIES: UbiA family prenyltransferase [unclassified Streptomyces]MYT74378.1 prenyltransferase [Streptomyces sp. SID8367]RAJ91355.1 4-hydroxybenzoate polyprenyltransferase [Streptomyces sp. PsTaAH-137]